MFQLIVSVIAIALVAILAAASIYYGGSAFSSSTAKGNVAALINAGQQIAGANALYKVDNTVDSASLSDLTAGGVYLSASPTPARFATGAWASNSTIAFIELKPAAAAQVCAEVVAQGGAATVAGSGAPTSVAGQFGCVNGYFVYRM